MCKQATTDQTHRWVRKMLGVRKMLKTSITADRMENWHNNLQALQYRSNAFLKKFPGKIIKVVQDSLDVIGSIE